jgi:hypothetical protein
VPGDILSGRYQLLKPIGAGGMGQVHLALDLSLERQVAVKLLPNAAVGDAVARERLRREALAAASLDHPLICKVHELAEAGGRLCLVMEYVPATRCTTAFAGPLPLKQVLQVAGEVAEALQTAHARGLVHCDLRAVNLLLTATGHVKVMDFGLARQFVVAGAGPDTATAGDPTGVGTTVGAPAYMSPEQMLGDPVDARSDIFSFGIVLAEMATGRHPYARPTASEVMNAILRDPPVLAPADSGLPPSLLLVIRRSLAKAPADRYQTMAEVLEDPRAVAGSGSWWPGVVATPVSSERIGAARTALIGRDSERNELLRLLDQALAGRGALVLIGGEPGIGKTRLTEEVLEQARRRGCLGLVGHCYEMEGAPPFVPFVELLEHSARVVPGASRRGPRRCRRRSRAFDARAAPPVCVPHSANVLVEVLHGRPAHRDAHRPGPARQPRSRLRRRVPPQPGL